MIHEVSSQALQIDHISRHGSTKVTHFELVYGQEVVLSVDVNLDAYRLDTKNDLSTVMYHNLMVYNIDEMTNKKIKTFEDIDKDKA